jgi:hypothetical protein
MATSCPAVEKYHDSRNLEGGGTLMCDREGERKQVVDRERISMFGDAQCKDGVTVVQPPCLSVKVCIERGATTWIGRVLTAKQQSEALWSSHV